MKIPGSLKDIVSDSQIPSDNGGTVTRGESNRNHVLQRSSTYSSDKVSISESISAKDPPSPLTYSGHGSLEVYPANLSVSYVVGHEQRHAQLNRMMAMARGEEVYQSITYSMGFQNGKLIVKGGVTEAEFVPRSRGSVQRSNATKQVADHTSLKNLSDVFVESFKFASRNVPNVTLLDGVISAVKVQNTLNELKKVNSPSVFERDISFNPVFLRQKTDSLVNLRDKLAKLEVSVVALRTSDSFNIHVPVSSDSDSLSAKTTIDAADMNHSVSISQLAANHRVVSDIHSDPFASLDLSGAFKVNGYEISVETSDSLYNIMNKINRGEDVNNNGTLDLSEDLNGNGSLDVFVLGEGENRKIVYEDVDSDRVLDLSEDINNNERIDGGSAQLRVKASIENNQLILTSLDMNRIELVDDNSLLDSIGVLTTDAHNNVIMKNDVATTQTYTILNRNPQTANLNVNGKDFIRNTNEISDIVADVTFKVKKITPKKVKVSISSDVLKSFNVVKNFLDNFNSTIKHINRQLEVKKIMKGNPDIQRIRKNLIDNVTTPTKFPKGNIDSVSKVGIKMENREKKNYNQITITNILKKLKGKLKTALSIPSRGSNSVFSNLSDLGIMSEKDDTFSIDEKNLKAALKDHPKEVFSLFSNKSDGIVTRLGEQLSEVLDLKFSNISRSQAVLSAMLGDTSSFDKVRKDIQNLQNSIAQGKSSIPLVK